MKVSRRYFLRSGGVALVGAGVLPGFLVRAASTTRARGRTLVVVFQRGAADGLNVVVPHGEKDYYRLRPSIAIPRPSAGGDGRALDLDGFFGFHPALAPLKELYDQGSLAVVHAAGSPDATRSHFDAQDFMETGTPGVKSTRDGWLNRHLQAAPQPNPSTFRGVSITQQVPRVLQGTAPAVAVPGLARFGLPGAGHAVEVRDGLEALYASSPDGRLAAAAREAFEAVDAVRRIPGGSRRQDYPRGRFGEALAEVAQLIRAGLGVEAAFVEIGGWDHHVAQGGAQGQMANLLRQFGAGLLAFQRDLGERMSDVVVLTLSEFGRTVAENGNQGTDHGHATTMLALGGPVRGGRVVGEWPGLREEARFEGRDLAVTTDFRDVLGELLVKHLGAADLESVFPGHGERRDRFRGLLA